jgi:hypothetical protein
LWTIIIYVPGVLVYLIAHTYTAQRATLNHDMFYLYTMRTQARRRASLHVACQILVHIFKHKEQYKLLFLFQPPAMADIKQPARKPAIK